MSSWIFLAVSVVGFAFSASALLRPRRLGFASFPYFMGAWLTGELALHHIAWQALATIVFAAFGALSSWPGVLGLALAFVSWGMLGAVHAKALEAKGRVHEALAELGEGLELEDAILPQLLPFRFARPEVERIKDVPYGEVLPGDKGGRNLLDVIRPRTAGEGRPVLVQIHGGAWVMGEKEQQGQPLMQHLASRGWVCFASNYRLSPRATFPDHIVDVKRALAWVRENASRYGGDPDFICITGGSAGGHLAALAGLSANDPSYQPGFEDADTRVQACVPFYGVYDFLDRHGHRGSQSMEPFLARTVFKSSSSENPELWENASPISRVHSEAPPFLVIQGTHDSLVFVEEAREFVSALREKSTSPVLYLELEGAQHAFDIFHSIRSGHAVRAATAFLERIWDQHRKV